MVVPHTRGAQVWVTQFYLQITPYLPLPRKHSPDDNSPDWGCGHLIAAYYSVIYPKRMKGWVELSSVCLSVCLSSFSFYLNLFFSLTFPRILMKLGTNDVWAVGCRADFEYLYYGNYAVSQLAACFVLHWPLYSCSTISTVSFKTFHVVVERGIEVMCWTGGPRCDNIKSRVSIIIDQVTGENWVTGDFYLSPYILRR